MELRECPFCGSDAKIEYEAAFGECLACCTVCDAMIEHWYPTEEEAAEAWNRRPEPAIPSDPLPPSPIDPVVQHHPCNDCPFDPATCKPEECERLKRYEAARKEEKYEAD